MWIGHREEIRKLSFQALAFCRNESVVLIRCLIAILISSSTRRLHSKRLHVCSLSVSLASKRYCVN